jgi:hypothetical protein
MTTETKVAAKAAGKRAISKMRLLGRVTCPHCWNQYAPENSLWISSDHDSLRDDTKIRGEPRRFPAERFHVSGDAIDARGERCAALACPNCHLVVPRVSYEFQPFFASIVGGPGCGKSFFLPAMTWTLRTTLPRQFATEFLDADPVFNLKLHEYERSLFLNPKRDEVVTIEKTMATAGQEGLYDQVVLGGKTVAFARPFLFRLQPNDHHPEANNREQSARTVCLYDNAGELYLPSFQPGDTSRATDHLGHTHLTMFLFDPTQDMRFRDACKGKSRDPQMQIRDQEFTREAAVLHAYLPGAVKQVSNVVRSVLLTHAPEIVSAAEGYSSNVTYVACSATGRNVQAFEGGVGAENAFGIRPRDVKPFWCDLPFLIGLHQNGLSSLPLASS